ncbi:g2799 [Coccomyxa viridis]|uniref:G2799 protein n=1 Tax=Coccomyxa viridis TaxID=1274662 RepID=A0ABP1FQ96_9CHLO
MTFYNEINSSSDAYKTLHEEEAGAFGTVQACQDTETGITIAIKYLKRGSGTISETVLQEIMAHRNLYHPNILLFKKVILNSQALGIVVEYQEGGSLDAYIRQAWPLQEPTARGLFQQIVMGLSYLEHKGVENHGIKAENMLLDKREPPNAKISSVGYYKATLDTVPKSRVGSFGFVAPEVLLNKKDIDKRKADCWSIGVILYQLLFGEHPFEKTADVEEGSVKRTLHRILKVEYKLPAHASSVSPEAMDLLQHVLVEDPTKRYCLQEMQNHPWFVRGLPASLKQVTAECMAMEQADHLVPQPRQETLDVIHHAMMSTEDDDSFQDDAFDEYLGDEDLDELMAQ